MAQRPSHSKDESGQRLEQRESPRHGFQGDRAILPPAPSIPASLTVAISREAGSRGGTIARRAGQKLGWQVYNQELLEYVAQEGAFRQGVTDSVSALATNWIEERLQVLLRQETLSQHPSLAELARIVLALGAQGEVILIGRGAGCILPPEATLHVRIIAPKEDRIAYMSQWLRLTRESAQEQVELRDSRRAEFVTKHFHRQPSDIYQYDLLLNSSLLGEDMCAELIAQAVRIKLAAYTKPSNSSLPLEPEMVE
ncbi:MAG TPA: cytidylate kinase-like family protein [Gemmataceae bacterium]|nr:cytidylate kinase-like family protein [Gemmataceae bacterium]